MNLCPGFGALSRPFIGVVLVFGATIAACGGGDSDAPSSPSSPAASSGPSEVAFTGEFDTLPGLKFDTGLQPAGSPVAAQFTILSAGKGRVDAGAWASGSLQAPVLTGRAGTGKVAPHSGRGHSAARAG